MGSLNNERTTIAGKLTAAGLTVTMDPTTAPPYILIGVPTVDIGAGIGGWPTDYPIHVVATNPGNAAALAWMLDNVESVLRTLGPARARPGVYGDNANPAYELTYRRDVANPDC